MSARSLIQRAAGALLAVPTLAVLRVTGMRAGVALVYHRVAPEQGDPRRELVPPLATRTFERQLRHLGRHYLPVASDDFLGAVAARRRGERFPVCVTLDDDVPEHAEHALPALRHAAIPATFFLARAGLREASGAEWWQRLQRAFDAGRVPAGLPGGSTDIHVTAEAIADLTPDERDVVERELAVATPEAAEKQVLSAEELDSLVREGGRIGFHTARHYRLTRLDDAELAEALRAGRAELERRTGRPLSAIAYPYGTADARVANAAREAGFDLGFTVVREAATPRSDPMLLGRLEPRGGPLGPFALLMVRTLLESRRRRA